MKPDEHAYDFALAVQYFDPLVICFNCGIYEFRLFLQNKRQHVILLVLTYIPVLPKYQK